MSALHEKLLESRTEEFDQTQRMKEERIRELKMRESEEKTRLLPHHDEDEGCCSDCCNFFSSAPKTRPISSFPLSLIQKQRLEELRRRVTTRYNPENDEHRRLLLSFGKIAFGDNFAEEELKSPKWKTIGFQGNDPSTDFRGAGLFGLENLKYFVHTQPECFKRIISRSSKMDIEYFLPFALTGLNLTFMISNLLCIGQSFRYHLSPESAIYYSAFILLVQEDEYAFEEIYCALFLCLEEKWTKRNLKYMNFPVLLEEMKALLCSVLKRQPQNLEQFKNFLNSLE